MSLVCYRVFQQGLEWVVDVVSGHRDGLLFHDKTSAIRHARFMGSSGGPSVVQVVSADQVVTEEWTYDKTGHGGSGSASAGIAG